MSASDKTALGDRMKSYESVSTSRKAFKGQPLMVRLDGKAFHTFTKGLKRPYDLALTELMQDTTAALVDRFQATVGYTQSDEITLVWYVAPDSDSQYPFDGRFQKLESLCASFCSVYFNSKLPTYLPEKVGQLPTFDARAFVLPTLTEAYHGILWRQNDCTKNAISMAAQSMFSHKALQEKNGSEMQEMMWSKHSVNFNDYPYYFKRGTFVRRVKRTRMLTDAEMASIPEEYRPVGTPVTRSFIEKTDIWLAKQEDPVNVLFFGADPVMVPSTKV